MHALDCAFRPMSSPLDSDYDEQPDGPSKSQLKREDAEMQALGTRLVNLSKANINQLPVNETLRDALLEFKRIKSHEAQRRHIKRVGRLLRDHDLDAVEKALERLSPDSSLSMASTLAAQKWCDRLIQNPREELTAFIDQFPDVEVQKLRQLLRKAQQQFDADTPSQAQRELLKFVRARVLAAY